MYDAGLVSWFFEKVSLALSVDATLCFPDKDGFSLFFRAFQWFLFQHFPRRSSPRRIKTVWRPLSLTEPVTVGVHREGFPPVGRWRNWKRSTASIVVFLNIYRRWGDVEVATLWLPKLANCSSYAKLLAATWFLHCLFFAFKQFIFA